MRQDLEAAKAYYLQAYREGHGLAIKKLKEWNFLAKEEKKKKSRFEVRCHEWGDGSDYNWCFCDTREEAVETVRDFYANDPYNTYEHLYVIEIKPDGTKENVPVDR